MCCFTFCVDMALSSTSTAKRKRVVLTIEDKLTVCDLVEKVPYTDQNASSESQRL